jgi:hypothetical protein
MRLPYVIISTFHSNFVDLLTILRLSKNYFIINLSISFNSAFELLTENNTPIAAYLNKGNDGS